MAQVPERPTPEQLLARIKAAEARQKRGRLKVFLGYAPGVGKTYSMLDAAQARKAEGVDVVVAYVETHDRPETETMLRGLEVIPRKRAEYHGVMLSEMDLDTVLKRKPTLALVDELAHTNLLSSRHTKRYQDVEELLAAGISVYTTLNIQHLESLKNVVIQITGVAVRENVPDNIIDENTEIELVDLPPGELLVRLKEGKVYIPEQAALAMQDFFRKGNLTALREMTMRQAAERVDEQMRIYMETEAIEGPWPASERLLVCLTPGMMGKRLVRTASLMAAQLDAAWFALYVETPEHVHLKAEEKERLNSTMRLVEQLGGHVVTLPGEVVADTILQYARQNNITKIIAGNPLKGRWWELLHRSMVDRLIHESGNIDVYVVSGQPEAAPRVMEKSQAEGQRHPWQDYGMAAGLAGLATLFGWLGRDVLAPDIIIMIYLIAVVIASVFLNWKAAITTTVLSVLAFDFFLTLPTLTLGVANIQSIFTFVAFVGVGLLINRMTARFRDQVRLAQNLAANTNTLYNLSRDLASVSGLDLLVQAVINNARQTFGRNAVILLAAPDLGGTLKEYARTPDFPMTENESAVATWAFQHGQIAGYGTDTLAGSAARYLPLRTARGVLGVIGVSPANPGDNMTLGQRHLFEAFADMAALAFERAMMAGEVNRNRSTEEAQGKT
jgi:two-component system, OmpR family, sensor histidine kinase KdpD